MDRVDRLADLRDEADRTAQHFERAASAPGPFVGTDSTGCVSVTADRAGLIEEVRVTADWRSHLGVDELATTVMSAYQAAGIARVERWGAALAESADGPAPTLRPLPFSRDTISGQLDELVRQDASETETRDVMEAIAEFLRDVRASIDDATHELARVQRTEVRGQSESRHVEAVVTGTGDLKDLRYDETWLGRAHPYNIGRETIQAQAAALRAVGGRTAESVMASTRLGELQALAEDPVAFARYLRMR